MKLSELDSCNGCGAGLGRMFYVVRSSLAFVSPRAADGLLGIAQILGGVDHPGVLRVAEALAPDAHVIKIAGEEDPQLFAHFCLCMDCATMGADNLPGLLTGGKPRPQERAEDLNADMLRELHDEAAALCVALQGTMGLGMEARRILTSWSLRFSPPQPAPSPDEAPHAPEEAAPPA